VLDYNIQRLFIHPRKKKKKKIVHVNNKDKQKNFKKRKESFSLPPKAA
jgi:hypothetical protein